MKLTLPLRLLLAGVLCLAALIALVVIEGRARAAGREVIVAMQPVDPRSILSGHYVQLNFTEPLDGAPCPPLEAAPLNDEGWVALKPRGERHVVAGAASTRAAAQKLGDVVVRGWASCEAAIPGTPEPNPAPGFPGALTLHIGVNRFHADQDEATAIETAMRDRAGDPRVAAILSIGADGTPRTKGIMIDGKRVELSWF